MTYILIILLFGSNGAPGGLSAEFSSQEACERAAKTIEQSSKPFFTGVRPMCVAKTSP